MSRARVRAGVLASLLAAVTACGGGSSATQVQPATLASLAFTVQPGAVVAGDVLTPGVEVAVLDAGGTLFTSPTAVTIAVTGGAALFGTTTVTATDGHAVFSDLSVHHAGSGYTLTATAADVPAATSAAFSVAAGAPDPAGSSLAASPDAVAADGTPVALTVTVGDRLGNLLAGQTVTLEASGAASVVQPSAATSAAGTTTGTVSARTAGTATISASVGATRIAQHDVAFTAPPAATGITVTSAAGATAVAAGATLQLSAAVAPAGAAQTVTWSTSAPGIATVSQDGLVTAAGRGPVTLTATAADGSGVTGSITLTSVDNAAIVVQQANAQLAGQWAAASFDPSHAISVSARYGPSGNAFKYVAASGYYGTASNGFVALPYPLAGDFTVTATVRIVSTPKVNTACGVGVGVTTGFAPTDRYAYAFLPTSSGAGSARYVNGATNVTGVTPPTVTFAIPTPTPVQVTFGRTGGDYTLGFNGSTTTIAAGALTDGTTAYGAGAVYPAISFNNVVAVVSGFVIKDGAGNTLFDSATGTLEAYVPASLTLASAVTVGRGQSATVHKGQSVEVTATAIAAGGGVAAVTAVAADPSVAGVAVTNGASGSTITLTGLEVGATAVTITNQGDPGPATRTRTLTVVVEEFAAADAYGSLGGRVYPASGAAAAYADGELSITFDAPPVLGAGGSIDIYSQADGSLVDRVFYAGETQTVAGVPVVVGPQLVRVSGNTLSFTPHFGKLSYGASYYVGISTTAVTGTLDGVPFAGLSNQRAVASWRFTTKAAPTLTAGATVTVDGSTSTSTADFRTLGGALMHLAANPIAGATAVTVSVAPGTYVELVNYRAATPNPGLTVTISGPAGNDRGDTCVIQYMNGGTWNGSQNARASFYFAGANLVLENLTLRNTADRATLAQAEAMYFDSRADYRMAANNCTFSSRQDTINTTGRTWIYNSFIEGNTDFIWGTADVSLFERCALRVVNDAANTTYSMFVARTGAPGAATVGKGYVLLDSSVSVDAGIKAAFGRDAGAGAYFDQVALVNNTFGGGGALLDPGLWVTTTAPTHLGDSTYVGWKAFGNTGLNAETIAVDPSAAATIADGGSEYANRDRILNRVITVSGGAPTGYAAAAAAWDVSSLANAWGAP